MTAPRIFELHRDQDVSGVSGTGVVATGVVFADGVTVIRWAGGKPSTVVWNSLDDAMLIHGHGGLTWVAWLSGPPCGELEPGQKSAIQAGYMAGDTIASIAAAASVPEHQVETYLRWWCDLGAPGAETVAGLPAARNGQT